MTDEQPDQANSAAAGPDIPPDRLAINPRMAEIC